MKKAVVLATLVVLLLPVVLLAKDSKDSRDSLVRFEGGIGVILITNVVVSTDAVTGMLTVTVTRNVVRGVNPPGQIWRIADLRANVKVDGRIKVDGEGLLLAGGNAIGTNANASVFATLFCANDGNTPHSSSLAGVPLEPNGDFRIDDILSAPPAVCTSPVLLIRNAANQTWFAAGIPKLDHD
jgi:hypothetical protein